MNGTEAKVGKQLRVPRKALKALQIREETDPKHVDRLADLLRAGIVLDPIVVYRDGKSFLIADGNHRYLAYEQIGEERVDCIVKDGSKYDAAKEAFAENDKHRGRPLNRADRRRVLEIALEADPKKTDRELADDFGCSPTTVGTVRRNLGTVQIGQSRVGRDGRIYTATFVPNSQRSRLAAPASTQETQELASKSDVDASPCPQPEASVHTPAAEVAACSQGQASGSDAAPVRCGCGAPKIQSAGSWLCRTCDLQPGDPEYLEPQPVVAKLTVTATTPASRTERPSKPPGELLHDCIATLGAFARALDATKRVNVEKFKSISIDIDEASRKLDEWSSELNLTT